MLILIVATQSAFLAIARPNDQGGGGREQPMLGLSLLYIRRALCRFSYRQYLCFTAFPIN